MSKSLENLPESNERLPSLDEFKRLSREIAQQELLELRSERHRGIPEEALLWLALSPGWTLPLASACEFPGVKQQGSQALFERLVEAGQVRAYPLSDEVKKAGGENYYAIKPEVRAEILQGRLGALPADTPTEIQDDKISAARELLNLTAEIAYRMQSQVTALEYLPGALKRWVELAVDASKSKGVIKTFNHYVQKAYADRSLTVIQDWVQAARWLTPLFAAALDLGLQIAIVQAGRFVELIHRRSHDAIHLVHFWHRTEQIQAVRQLMDGPDQAWALHFIGAGGVGKTTLIRYITCMVNAVEGDPCYGDEPLFDKELALARIDFDYLNPDFPRLHPGLLLNALAQELRAYAPANSRAAEWFNRAEEAFEELHQTLKSRGYHPDQLPTDERGFRLGLRYFIDALRALDKRVLIILDTCEELEKAIQLNKLNTNVKETFRILRALHDGPDTLAGKHPKPESGLPGLRVILSGRRLLAGSGMGWSSSETGLPHRDYLRLFWVRGFMHSEASEYLAQEGVPKNLISAVIQASSPDAGSAVRFEFEDQPADEDNSNRCNPYKLNDYMSWALEERPPSPQQLLDTRGSYTQVRIIGRLRHPLLKRVLPDAVWLGHFDQDLLGAAASLSGDDLATAFELLQQQEWVERRMGLEIVRPILSLHKTTRDQLYIHYFASGKDLVPPETRQRVQTYLTDWMNDQDLGKLEWTDFDAALRVFEPDFEAGAEWWRQVEARLFAERDPQRILDTLGVLVGKHGSVCLRSDDATPDTPPENCLRPFVLATLAAAHLQLHAYKPLEKLWDEVITNMRQMVLNGGTRAARNLYRRALAGRVSLARYDRFSFDYALPGWFWEAWSTVDTEDLADPQLLAAWVAGCEGLVEAIENQVDDPYGLELGLVTQLDPLSVIQALGWAAVNLNRRGSSEPEQLLTWAENLTDQRLTGSSQISATESLVQSLLDVGQIEEARQKVSTLPALYHRCKALCSLAHSWALQENDKSGRLEAARQALNLARRLSKFDWVESSTQAVEVLCDVALALHVAGEDLDVVQQVLLEAETTARELQDEGERASALVDVLNVYTNLEKSGNNLDAPQPVLVLLQESDYKWARNTVVNCLVAQGHIDEAQKLAEEIQDIALQAEALSRVVDGLVAKEDFEPALKAVEQINYLPFRCRARLRVAQQLRRLGETQENDQWAKQASDLLERCLAERDQAADPIVRDELVADLAYELLDSGQKERLLALTVGMRSREALDEVWAILAREEIYGGNFKNSLQFAHRLAESPQQLTLLSDIYSEAPDDIATQLLTECRELAGSLYQKAATGSGLILLARHLSTVAETRPDIAEGGLLAFGYSLAARGLTLVDDALDVQDLWSKAIQSLPDKTPSNLWMDWLPPPDLAIRLQLDLARTACPALFSPQKMLEMLESFPDSPSFTPGLDIDRLASIKLALRLASGIVEAEELAQLEWANPDTLMPIYYEDPAPAPAWRERTIGAYETVRRRLFLDFGDCNSQRRTPPLLVTACKAWAALGQVDFAILQLSYLANGEFFDMQVREHAERALLGLIRFARLFEIGQETATSLQNALDFNDLGLIWSVDLLSGQRRGRDVYAEANEWINNTWALPLHHAWRSLPAALAVDQVECIEFGLMGLTRLLMEGKVDPGVEYAWAALALDLLELQRMVKRQDDQLVIQTSSSLKNLEGRPAQRSALGLGGNPLWQIVVERSDQGAVWKIQLAQEIFYYSLDVAAWAKAHPKEPEAALRLFGRLLALAEVEPSSYPSDRLPDELLDRLGFRRAGQVLYEEAEMLAQRLPGAAAMLFGLVGECFRQAGDLQGQFLAVMSQALAYTYEGSVAGGNMTWTVALERSLETASPLYESLRQRPSLKTMPAWRELENLATELHHQHLNNLAPSGWKPWLARSAACLARQRQLSGKDINLEGLQTWLSESYGVERANLERRLPVEWLAFYKTPDKERDWFTIVSIVIGSVMLLGCCLGGFYIFRSQGGFWNEASIWEQIAIYGGLIFALLIMIGVSSLAWGRYQRRQSNLELVLSIQTPDQFKELIINPEEIYLEQRPVPFDAKLLHWKPRWRLGWPIINMANETIRATFKGKAMFGKPYSDLGVLLPQETRRQLETMLLLRNLNNPHRAVLSIDDGLHGLACEAILVNSLRDNELYDTPIRLPFRFERTVRGDLIIRDQLKTPLLIASLVDDAVAEGISKDGLQALDKSDDFDWIVNPSATIERYNIWGVHLIGSVQVGYNRLGVRLESVEAVYESQDSMSQSKAPGDSSRLLTAGELRRAYPQMRLFIVQNIVSGLESRVETERLEASLARIFAAQVATRNGAAVLVLPPLPVNLASRALKILSAALPLLPRQGSTALRQAVAEIQEMLLKEIPDNETAWEVALDLCLYVPEQWKVW